MVKFFLLDRCSKSTATVKDETSKSYKYGGKDDRGGKIQYTSVQ